MRAVKIRPNFPRHHFRPPNIAPYSKKKAPPTTPAVRSSIITFLRGNITTLCVSYHNNTTKRNYPQVLFLPRRYYHDCCLIGNFRSFKQPSVCCTPAPGCRPTQTSKPSVEPVRAGGLLPLDRRAPQRRPRLSEQQPHRAYVQRQREPYQLSVADLPRTGLNVRYGPLRQLYTMIHRQSSQHIDLL